MTTIPAPTAGLQREEWEDADFDIPEGMPLHTLDAESDKDDEEDWDMEMDLGQTGGAKAKAVVAGMKARSQSFGKSPPPMFTIRQPLPQPDIEEDEDDEGVSTIKVAVLPKTPAKSQPLPIDEDMESDFALPSDLTRLSLAPATLSHRSSKNSLEWGEKDQTSSSQSSDAYSSLGFADASPSSSNSVTSASLPGSESEGDDENSELDGLVIPAVFESGDGGKQLKKMLELKKKVQFKEDNLKVSTSTPDPEDDFEVGLVIDDEADLSPSRLMLNVQQPRTFNRSKSAPTRPLVPTRPLSRIKSDRAKSPPNPPTSSTRQFQRLKFSPSPPPKPTRQQPIKDTPSTSPISFLSPKPGGLRGQKSHSGLKPPSPPSTQRKLVRKASLSSLMEKSQSQAAVSGMPSPPAAGPSNGKLARYEIPTAASRAKSHTSSTSRIHGLEHIVPPTRPSTPSSNPVALRLTMPTSIRMKSRPSLSSVFPSPSPASAAGPSAERATSPPSTRPPSSLSLRSRPRQGLDTSQPPASKVLRRSKRQRTYGDGTELDDIDDLPTDRDKEGRFRVTPKGYGNRVPGGTYSSKDKGTVRKKGHKEGSNGSADIPLSSSTNSLKRPNLTESPPSKTTDPLVKKKKKDASSPTTSTTKRKPTLIRNLGGTGSAKVVGDMKWNPSTLRWEGNDQVLRDFDAAIGTSTRPALITHLTGSSIGSPVGSFASGARKVGNMIFDPTRMCWISTLTPEEDEPDVFAHLADDEEDGWETKGGTIRVSQQQAGTSSDMNGNTSTPVQAPSPAPSRTRTTSESGSDRGSRASMVYDVDDSFLDECRAAEERHRAEMKGWKFKPRDPLAEPDRSYLYEIRALATRKY